MRMNMGGCVSATDKVRKERSEEIDSKIEDQKRFKLKCKILLLGAYSSVIVSGRDFIINVRLWRIGEEHNS